KSGIPANRTGRLSVYSTEPGIVGHPVNRHHIASHPSIDLELTGELDNSFEAANHYVREPGIDNVLGPEETHPVLDPLKVRNSHPTRICQNIRYYENILIKNNFIGLGGSGPIGAFRKYFALEPGCIVRGYHVLGCGGDQYVALEFEEFLVSQNLGAWETFYG